ncbi:MAG: DUF6240 domain-containing protein [Lachnospiraceae bacterium]|nr:DUF6240 domain-containing protein [Lachnospiraceae bacterium]
MRISDIYNNTNIHTNPQYGTGAADIVRSLDDNAAGGRLSGVKNGDIIEGMVSDISRDTTKVSFQNGECELAFSKNSIDRAFVGQKRAFEVVENTPGKLVLRDLGGIAGEIDARSIQRTNVDTSLVTMANDFAETNGGLEKEDDGPIERLTDEDYSELKQEGFSIEDFKAERLSKAIERIKAGRAAKQENIEQQSEELKNASEEAKRKAAASVSARYASYQIAIDKLYAADMPITDANIAAVASAMSMSSAASGMTDYSFAYLIKNELTPSIKNIYTSVYSGIVRSTPVDDASWKQLEEPARVIVDEANALLGTGDPESAPAFDAALSAPVDTEDARWMIEHEIPLNSTNLVYKKELEELKGRPVDEEEAAGLAAEALAQGENADEAVLIPSHRTVSDKPAGSVGEQTAILRLQEIRLSMTTDLRAVESLEKEIAALRDSIRSFYDDLAGEIGAAGEDAQLAMQSASVLENIANAPLDIYRTTFSVRATITLAELGTAGEGLIASSLQSSQVVTVRALAEYDASQTEIRTDLGDSIRKAFRNADALVEQAGLEVNDANLKAVRILGYNSMEINADSIREMKYYDTKLTGMLEGMKPSVVLSMIRDGFNPLEHDIDSINEEIGRIMDREGYSPEEKFSSFLVRLDQDNAISESEREAYIGIYRLLYQIGKDDGAVIGSALAAGRELTLSNLLVEARTRYTKIDTRIDDGEAGSITGYTNSISDQIMAGFAGNGQGSDSNAAGGQAGEDNAAGSNAARAQQVVTSATVPELSADQQRELEYNVGLAKDAMDVTEPAAWSDAIDEDYENFTLEQVTLRLQNADKQYNSVTGTAETVRTVMMASAGSRNFLKSLGVKDSKNNLEALETDPALEIASKDELLDSLDDYEDMQRLYSEKTAALKAEDELELLGGIAILSRGRQIAEQLHSCDLLSDMAGSEHYRVNVAGGDQAPARINLTVIHGTQGAGTVSIAVSTSSYSLQADLNMTVYTSSPADEGTELSETRVSGKVALGSGDRAAAQAALNSFIEQMAGNGYDASDIVLETETFSAERYMESLTRMQAAQPKTDAKQPGRRGVSTNRLYGIAKVFLTNFV